MTELRCPAPSPSEIIELLGGTSSTARLADISQPSVSNWRHKGVPKDKLMLLAPEIERRSNQRWPRWALFPDDWHRIWPELIGADGAPPVPEGEAVREGA
jgi:hypothetical protein